MPVPNPNSLQRMTITAVNDDANRAEKSDGRFEVMFNPNSYSISYRNQLERHNTRQPQLPKVESRGTDNQTFQVTLIIDGTGLTDVDGQSVGSADKAGEGTWVKQKLQRFLRICQETQEDPHSPNLLHVQWGIIDFYGRLQSVQINFTLFAPNGRHADIEQT